MARYLPKGRSERYLQLLRKYRGVRNRCENRSCGPYAYYGGKGIVVCAEWRASFAAFYAWAEAAGWRPGLELDRIDAAGPYSPENCRFVTHRQNTGTRATSLLFSWHGATLCVQAIYDLQKRPVSITAVFQRLRRGYDLERALSEPPIRGRPRPSLAGKSSPSTRQSADN